MTLEEQLEQIVAEQMHPHLRTVWSHRDGLQWEAEIWALDREVSEGPIEINGVIYQPAGHPIELAAYAVRATPSEALSVAYEQAKRSIARQDATRVQD